MACSGKCAGGSLKALEKGLEEIYEILFEVKDTKGLDKIETSFAEGSFGKKDPTVAVAIQHATEKLRKILRQ